MTSPGATRCAGSCSSPFLTTFKNWSRVKQCRNKDHLSFYSERNVHRHIDGVQITDTFRSVGSGITTWMITVIKHFHHQWPKIGKCHKCNKLVNLSLLELGLRNIEVLDRLDKAVNSRRMFVLLASLPQLFDSLSKKTYVECWSQCVGTWCDFLEFPPEHSIGTFSQATTEDFAILPLNKRPLFLLKMWAWLYLKKDSPYFQVETSLTSHQIWALSNSICFSKISRKVMKALNQKNYVVLPPTFIVQN